MSNAPRPALLAGALVAVVLTACSSLGVGPAPATGALGGRTFLSTRVTQNGADRPLVAGSRIRLSFLADGGLGVSAGCNSISGSYTLTGTTLTFTGGGMTQMACDAPLMEQDGWITDLLGKGPTVALNGPDLLLTVGDTAIALQDREVAEPDLPLVGPTWTLDSIVTGDAVSSVAATATLTFGADGRVTLDTGCNTGAGSYLRDGPTIRFSDVVTTKRACDQAAGSAEGPMLQLLRADAVSWSIDAARLSLRVGATGLDLVGR